MKRTHLSSSPDQIKLVQFDHVIRRSCNRCMGAPGKPAHAFWYEIDDDWKRWCKDERFCVEKYAHEHLVDLGDANVLFIDNARDLLQFSEDYKDQGSGSFFIDFYYVDWSLVAKDYGGIEIAPYLWECRLNVGWYYGWDCASGAIWRPKNVSVSYVGPVSIEAFESVES
jgi:hypothetical protein